MPKVKVGDIKMYYEIHGKGEPLVFISGFGGSTSSMLLRVPAFSPEYRVVVFDTRGAGQSDAPDIPYTMDMMADDLAGLLDVIGIKAAHISGESFGGGIAQLFALRYPKRVISLILVSTSCGTTHSISSPELIKFLADIPKMTPEERIRAQIRLFVTQEFAAKNPVIMQRMLERMMERPASPQGTRRQLQATGTGSTYERLPEIKAPTLIIAGDADRAVPVENSRILASRIPHAELVILKNAGHLLLEVEEELNRVMLDFLKRHRTKKA
jgi:pimeloyl-ACP methyl ester carboxylesterase